MTGEPKRLFLVDGVGAIVTATLLLAVLAPFESTFGMPRPVIYSLAAVAGVFAVYTMACCRRAGENWRPFLAAIAAANLAYCLITVLLLITFRNEITALGVAYFVGEIIVIASLATYELKAARTV